MNKILLLTVCLLFLLAGCQPANVTASPTQGLSAVSQSLPTSQASEPTATPLPILPVKTPDDWKGYRLAQWDPKRFARMLGNMAAYAKTLDAGSQQ